MISSCCICDHAGTDLHENTQAHSIMLLFSLLAAGDISYASGQHHKWNHFMDAIEPFASRIPYMISIGKPIMNRITL